MRKLLFCLAILLYPLINTFSQQDTLVTVSGDILTGKIIRVSDDSVKISFKNNGKTYTNCINRDFVKEIKYGREVSRVQYKRHWNDRSCIFTLDFLMPSAGIQAALGNNSTIVLSYDPGFIFSKHNDEPTIFTVVNQFKLAPRIYTNIAFREFKGRSTYKFSGTFFSTWIQVGMASDFTDQYLLFGPTYGIQRTLGNVGHFSIEIGLGFANSETYTGIEPIGDISFGFAL